MRLCWIRKSHFKIELHKTGYTYLGPFQKGNSPSYYRRNIVRKSTSKRYLSSTCLFQEAIPSWGDRHDILSLLRACNYDPDECITTYFHLERDGKSRFFSCHFILSTFVSLEMI